MPITDEEMNALRQSLKEEIEIQIRPFREEVNQRFSDIARRIDGLYQRDERREQEYLAIREQIQRLETRIA